MMLHLIHTVDLLLWSVMAVSVAYVTFFALVSLFRPKRMSVSPAPPKFHFLVLIPAYSEDRVIRQSVASVLRQDYPHDLFHLMVISDHMKADTNEWLATQPLTLCLPQFERSSKAKALQYAMKTAGSAENHNKGEWKVVILDADNVVGTDFLSRLNTLCVSGQHRAIQCHRTAKNNDNGIAALDGASEEINNTLFRSAHNRIGLSSALIGSGMCFDEEWFRTHVGKLSTAGEDRELEALLLRQRIHVHYADDILVMDEKVSSGDNFQHQRLRWMSAQVQCLLSMLPYLPKALATANIDYLDKTLQQALIPRSVLLVACTFMALLTLMVIPGWSVKWWVLTGTLSLALCVALPSQLRTRALFSKVVLVPQLVGRMLGNILHIDTKNKEFIHTTHDQ